MICFRTKAKVRYAILICLLSALGVYIMARFAGCCGDLLPEQKGRNVRHQLVHHTFTAKWHDSRELLNDLSDTQERARARARILRHMKQKQPHKLLKTSEENTFHDEARNEVEIMGREVEIEENIEQQNYGAGVLDETLGDATVESYLATTDAEFGDSQTVTENEHRFLNEDHNRKTQAIRFARSRRGGKRDEFPDGAPMERNKDDANGETGLGQDPQRLRVFVRRNDAENADQLNAHKPNNLKGKKSYVRHKNDHVTRQPDHRDSHAVRDINHAENDRGRLGWRDRKGERERPSKDINYGMMKKSNRTIFHPSDSEIKYHAPFSTAILINKSRLAEANKPSDFPMTPDEALTRYKDRLPAWERFEIFHYPKIYYLGLRAKKTQLTSNETNNFGFDEDPGSHDEWHYKVVVGDHIGYRYEIIKFLGSGTFGSVVLARDWSNPAANNVALKIMHYDEDLKYILREIDMNKYIGAKATNFDYFPRMIATFKFRNHHCLVLELLGKSLHRRHNSPVRNMTTFRRYVRDILAGLKVLNELNIVHGDMKPENIMYVYGKNNKSEGQLLKIADFGIGCIPGDKAFKCPAYYLQTRYYRAPEVILSLDIGPHVDMFSIGVIFTEFYLGVPPFFGETETDQLAAMMEVLGLPPTFMIARSPRRKIYTRAMCYETDNGFHRKPFRKPLTKMLKGMAPDLFDLIARCLEYDPRYRITPQQALKHPFVTGNYPSNGFSKPLSIKRLEGKE